MIRKLMIIYKHYTREDLDRQYNARVTVPDFARIVEDWNRRSKELRKHANMCEEVRYGNGERELMDVFPAPKSDSPLLAFFHGGYWQALDKRVFHFVAKEFIEREIAVAVVNYPLAPAASMDEIVESCRKALGFPNVWNSLAKTGSLKGLRYNKSEFPDENPLVSIRNHTIFCGSKDYYVTLSPSMNSGQTLSKGDGRPPQQAQRGSLNN